MSRRIPEEVSGMRVAMVAACPFPSSRGSQVLIRELAQTLAERGHRVHLVTYPHGENLTPLHGFLVHRVRAPRWLSMPVGLGWRKAILDLYLVAALYRVVRREGIDVIHAHNYEAPLVSFLVRFLTGVPVVYHSHNALSDELAYYFRPGRRRWLARVLGRFLDRQIPRRADFSIALTPQLGEFLRQQGVSAQRLVTIAPGLLPGAFAEPRTVPNAFAGRFVVMYAGNLDPYQDLDVLLDAFVMAQSRIGQAVLVVVTHDGSWAQRLHGRLAALARVGAVHVIVASTFTHVRRLLASADVLVSPRSSWSGFPIKMLNYMASGRAIVSAQGSAKGLVDGETALVVPNRDVAAMARGLVRLFSDAQLRQQLGERARLAARATYSWEHAVAQIETIYAKLCRRALRDGVHRVPGVSPTDAWSEVPGGRVSAASGRRRE
jgi:1,2-diacylglycerol 3-alpha-glucosyltransferase